MQTTTLPLQLNINGAATAQRSNAANAASDTGQFGAMLSNELAQAQAPAPAPAPAAAPQAPAAPRQDASASTPAQADQSDGSDDASATQPSSATSTTGSASSTKQADADAGAKPSASKDDDSDAAAQKSADPANAMLALIASLQHPGAKAAVTPKTTTQAGDVLGASTAKRTDATQLAALQGALKPAAKGSADAKSLGADAKNAALAGADDKAAGSSGAADLTAALGGAGLKTGHKAELDAADLSLQQVRDAAQQTAQQDPSAMAAAALAQTTQPAALEAAQAAAGAAEQLTAQVGTDTWENQVGQKVVYMLGNEEQTASLTLNPPDLGPLQVVLSVSNDQANVTFSSNHEEVRQALENALPRLREMMGESGIALGNASVNAGSQNQQQAQQGSSSRGGRNYGNAGGVDAVSSTDTSATRVTRTAVLGDRGMVDTFA